MNPTLVKLVSGETIIGTVERKGTALVVNKPMVVKEMVDEDNNLYVALTRWIDTKEEEVTIKQTHVIITTEPNDNISEYYVEQQEEIAMDKAEQEAEEKISDGSNIVSLADASSKGKIH